MLTANEVAEKVETRLQQQPHFGTIKVKVLRDGVRLERDHWYVPVQPSEEPERYILFYDALAEVEMLLLDEDDLNVAFIPTTADVT